MYYLLAMDRDEQDAGIDRTARTLWVREWDGTLVEQRTFDGDVICPMCDGVVDGDFRYCEPCKEFI